MAAQGYQPPPPPKRVPDDELLKIVGACHDEREINRRILWASRECFLLPRGSVCSLPYSGVVTFSPYWVNPDDKTAVFSPDGGSTYGLSQSTLETLSGMAGLEELSSQQVDPFNVPRLMNWQTVMVMLTLSGVSRKVIGDGCLDLRTGSDEYNRVLRIAKPRTNRDGSIRVPASEVGRINVEEKAAKMRQHVSTGAKLRAIRKALSITSYSREQLLTKPFVVVSLSFSGRDAEDPDMERENKRAQRARMLGGVQALYAGMPMHSPPPAIPAPLRIPAMTASAPHTEEGEVVDDGVYEHADEHEHKTSEAPHAPPPATPKPAQSYPEPNPTGAGAPPAATASSSSGAAGPAHSSREPSGFTIPGGRNAGQPIEDAEDRDLQFWIDRIGGDLDNPQKARWRDKNLAQLQAMQAELQQRKLGSVTPGEFDEDDIPN